MKTFSLGRFRSLPIEIHIMMAGTMLTRGAYFMVWPFLAIVLYRQFHISATSIGALLTIATIFGAVSGVYTGWLSDRYGRRKVIVSGALLSALSFGLLSLAKSPVSFGLGIAGVSVGCMLLESSCKALIGDRIKDKVSRELAFYCRYYAINIGAAIGPLFGITIGIAAQSTTFLLTASIYLIYGALLWYVLPITSVKNFDKRIPTAKDKTSFKAACIRIVGHRIFTLLLICNLLAALVYANFDSSMVQYLTRSKIPDVIQTVAWLITINALIILVFQFPLLKVLQSTETNTRTFIGMILMFISQCLYMLVPASSFIGLAVATIILSLGELIVFPTFSVQIDRMTPDNLRGSYFGAGNLSMLGNSIAPVYGGIMLDNFGHQTLFLGLAVICVLVIYLQNKAKNIECHNQDAV